MLMSHIFFGCISPFTFFVLIFVNSSFAQTSVPADTALIRALEVYRSAIGGQSGIYNGVQYRRYPYRLDYGQPFFMGDSLAAGSVIFDGQLYNNVRLMYDEVNDQVITTDWQGDNLVQLYKDRVASFRIGSHDFLNVKNEPSLRPGYYRIVYNGSSQMLARETKSIQVKTLRTGETERSVYGSTDYYLKTAKGFQKFNRLTALMNLFGKQEKEVQKYISRQRVKNRSGPEVMFIEAASYYDAITN
jgi:hypothetical protein